MLTDDRLTRLDADGRRGSFVYVPTDKHGAAGVVDDVVADAAHDGASQLAHAARSHHDVRALLLLGRVADELARLLKVGHELAGDLREKRRRSDVRRTSDGRRTDVGRTSDGRRTDVGRTSYVFDLNQFFLS